MSHESYAVARRVAEAWIDVGACGAHSERYEFYAAGWQSWLRRTLRLADQAPYWWPTSTPIPPHALTAKRLHILYRVSDQRIIQFIAIV